MKRLLIPVGFMLTTFILLSCGDSGSSSSAPASESSFDLAAARAAIEATNTEFSELVAKGDSAGITALYTSDAKMMGANLPAVTGMNAIQSTWSGLFNAMGPVGISLTTVEVWGNESMVSEEGTFVLKDKDGNQIDNGKYIVLWKMEDGKWKLFRDIWNSDNPLPSSN